VDQLIPAVSSFKIFRNDYTQQITWADHVNYKLRKVLKALHFIMCKLKWEIIIEMISSHGTSETHT